MSTTKVTFTLPDELAARLDSHAGPREKSNIVTKALTEYFARGDDLAAVHERYGSPSDKAMAWARKAAGQAPEPGDEALLAEVEADRGRRWSRAG